MANHQKVVPDIYLSNGASFNDPEQLQPSFQGHAILWRWIFHKQLKIRPQLLWKVNRKLHPIFRMVPVWMILSDI